MKIFKRIAREVNEVNEANESSEANVTVGDVVDNVIPTKNINVLYN